jgi:hypothetical protein
LGLKEFFQGFIHGIKFHPHDAEADPDNQKMASPEKQIVRGIGAKSALALGR